jgi:hypothetical protein
MKISIENAGIREDGVGSNFDANSASESCAIYETSRTYRDHCRAVMRVRGKQSTDDAVISDHHSPWASRLHFTLKGKPLADPDITSASPSPNAPDGSHTPTFYPTEAPSEVKTFFG